MADLRFKLYRKQLFREKLSERNSALQNPKIYLRYDELLNGTKAFSLTFFVCKHICIYGVL